MRILLVAHYASESLGGEALIPIQLFRNLTRMGHDVWLVTHESAHSELGEAQGLENRVIFTKSLPGLNWVFTAGERLPAAPRQIAWAVTQIERQLAMAPVVRRLVNELDIDVVHQPISVSPSIPSAIRRLTVPVVMGPLNGGMDLPPGFRSRDSTLGRLRKRSRPILTDLLNSALRGRREADAILVANERTLRRLPRAARLLPTFAVSDVGVDIAALPAALTSRPVHADVVQILFAGRLVFWKGADLLLDAFAKAVERLDGRPEIALRIIGDGPCRDSLTGQAEALGLSKLVHFDGWQDRPTVLQRMNESDVFVLPSLEEAGGAVLLEAMACGCPVIAANWGGPAYIVDDSCGLRVAPENRSTYVYALADAIMKLAGDADLRERLGASGRRRVHERYDWDRIAAQVVGVYEQVLQTATGSRHPGVRPEP